MSFLTDLSSTEDPTINRPRFIETSLIYRTNYFVITDGVTFSYYPIKVSGEGNSEYIFRLEKLPPVLLEGMALIGKKVYLVPYTDLIRRVVRKSREIKQEVNHASVEQSVSDIVGAPAIDTLSSLIQSGTIDDSEVEIAQAADAAWQDQIGALFDNVLEEEEEWEAADAP